MNKRFPLTLLILICAIVLSACMEKTQTDDGHLEQPTDVSDYTYPSEDAGPVTQESPLGYSMVYDPTVFTLDDTGEADIFIYHTSEPLEAPVSVSVLAYPDMDAETLAEGIALQSGMDGATVQDTYFGAEGMLTKNVYLEKEFDGMTQIQVFYAIPAGEGSLLVEINGYIGMPANAEWMFEEMLGTFSLQS